MSKRCGECENCKKVDRVRALVLAAVNPPFSSATDAMGRDLGVVDVWNDALRDFPCTGKEVVK